MIFSKEEFILKCLKFTAARDPEASLSYALEQAESFSEEVGFWEKPEAAPKPKDGKPRKKKARGARGGASSMTKKETEALSTLIFLAGEGEVVGVVELAEALEKSPATAAALLKQLVKKSLVEEEMSGRKKIYKPLVTEVPTATA